MDKFTCESVCDRMLEVEKQRDTYKYNLEAERSVNRVANKTIESLHQRIEDLHDKIRILEAHWDCCH